MSDTRSLVRSSATVAAGTLLSRLTGLARVAAAAYALGTGADRGDPLADTYNRANSTPNIVYELILGGVLTATLVPLFVDADERDDERATSAVFTVAVAALGVLTVVAVLAAPLLARVLSAGTPGDRAESVEVGTTLIRLFMPQIVFYGFTALASALLNARRQFAAAAFAPVLNNVVVITVFLALPRVANGDLNIREVQSDTTLLWLLGLGTTAGIVAMALALVPALARSHPRPGWRFEPRHPAVVRMLRLSGWTVGYVVANQIALFTVIVVASADHGAFSAYQMAFVFFQLPHGLFAVSIMTTFGPELASLALAGDRRGLSERFASGLRLLVLIVTPAALAFLILARPIVSGLLERGEFAAASTDLTSAALAGFAVGLVAFSVYLYTLRLFYAHHDTRTPFLINCGENAVNVVLAIALFPAFGVRGLAIAYSVAYLISATVAVAVARRRLGLRLGPATDRAVVNALVAGLAGSLAAYGVARLFGAAHPLVAAVAGTLTLGAAYAAVLRLRRTPELDELLGVVLRRR